MSIIESSKGRLAAVEEAVQTIRKRGLKGLSRENAQTDKIGQAGQETTDREPVTESRSRWRRISVEDAIAAIKGKGKIVSVEEAVHAIKSGDRVVFGHAAGGPQVVPAEMVAQKDRLQDVQIFHMYSLDDGRYLSPEFKNNFHHVTSFVTANSRQAIAEGRADYLPCFFHRVPKLFDREFPVDVAVVSVSSPNEKGYCSFGVSCDYTKAAAEHAKIIIAEMNDQMPWIKGDNCIHFSKLDYIIPTSKPLYETTIPVLSDIDRAIGNYCASLIEDGDTIQLGIGNIPYAILTSLGDKKDLGVHTEMFSDTMVDLVENGVITGARKTLHRGKLIATFLMGSKKLYDFVDDNPMVELYPVSYVNDPRIIALNDNFVSVNSSIEIDLQGQVAAESIGLKQYSGTGGQVDFLRGTAYSRGGRSIIAMPSTASKGTVSRIVPFLTKGAAVTSSRNDVDYVVTEYGIARLGGKTMRERARALTDIAHPQFRECLEEEFGRRFPKNIF